MNEPSDYIDVDEIHSALMESNSIDKEEADKMMVEWANDIIKRFS